MTERKWIEWLKGAAARVPSSGVVLGIGDDCAIFRPKPGEDLLFTTDLMVEDVHFQRHWPAATVGHRALARGLSDLAACGGDPRFCLLSLALPDWAQGPWLKRFYGGVFRLAGQYNVQLAGGDLAASPRFTCDIVATGAVPAGTALRRDGARPGDSIYVSGNLGAAAVRLDRKPQPRIALGKRLRGRASAAMDLSDGLSLDLSRLCQASGVAAELTGTIPVARGATLENALHFGEDYELLVTGRNLRFPGLTRIGEVVAGRPGSIRLAGKTLEPKGWDHFR